jgi:hypothetical protein
MPAVCGHFDVPPEIAASPLYAAGGFAIIPDLFAADALADLMVEALSVRPTGQRNVLAVVSDGTEGRGGSPGRAFTSAHGREVQWRLFSAPALLASLSQLCGLAEPTGGGTYTYYEQPGDFLALHRDIVTCDLALLTCLGETCATPSGGGLLVYPGHATEPLSSARAAGRSAAKPVLLGPGETVALLGGIVPHEVAPMQLGQSRIVSVMCYRLPVTSDSRL